LYACSIGQRPDSQRQPNYDVLNRLTVGLSDVRNIAEIVDPLKRSVVYLRRLRGPFRADVGRDGLLGLLDCCLHPIHHQAALLKESTRTGVRDQD
jgi:hypothetical protein